MESTDMTTPTNTPTPRTDEAQKEYAYVGNKGAVSSKFARLLERENQQLQRERDEAKALIVHNDLKRLKQLSEMQSNRDHFKQLAAERWQMCEELADSLNDFQVEHRTCFREAADIGHSEFHTTADMINKMNHALSHFHSLQQQKKDEKV